MKYSSTKDLNPQYYPKEWLADENTRLAAKQSRLEAIAAYALFSAKKKIMISMSKNENFIP